MTDVDDKAIGVEERLASWASSAKTSTETLLGALSGLSERFRGRVESLSEHLDGSVNEGSVRVEATFLSQAIQSLEAAALGARAASALLSKARDEGVGEFDGALSGVLGKIRPILDVIQTIKPVLELARTML
ncbi:MAG: hypothetical protein KF718_05295 [Polyangiaceae bacterium]|nr:hypothetical protein [Polyangiaceae bacterium]